MEITMAQIEAAAEEMVEVCSWGFKVFGKVFGKWELSYLLMTDPANRQSFKVYPDERPSEIIPWAM